MYYMVYMVPTGPPVYRVPARPFVYPVRRVYHKSIPPHKPQIESTASAKEETVKQEERKKMQEWSLFSDKAPYVWPDLKIETLAPKETPLSDESESDESTSSSSVPAVEPPKPELYIFWPREGFFRDANHQPFTLVVGKPTFHRDPVKFICSRLGLLRSVANDDYGIVQIVNTFTSNSAPKISPPLDSSSRPTRMYGRGSPPPSPIIPIDKDSCSFVLYQIGFANGRQGIFQGLDVADCGTPLSELVGQWVVLDQDNGVDVGLLRAVEPLEQLVPHIPEAPFMRVHEPASKRRLEQLHRKANMEEKILRLSQDVLAAHRTQKRVMTFDACEIQLDEHKVILYASMDNYVDFNNVVTAIRVACEKRFECRARIFVQRRNKASQS
jgi:hypothetical protein